MGKVLVFIAAGGAVIGLAFIAAFLAPIAWRWIKKVGGK